MSRYQHFAQWRFLLLPLCCLLLALDGERDLFLPNHARNLPLPGKLIYLPFVRVRGYDCRIPDNV